MKKILHFGSRKNHEDPAISLSALDSFSPTAEEQMPHRQFKM